MYVPKPFEVSDRATLFDFIEENSFGMLVTRLDDRPFASHLPLLVERSVGENGRLVGHMARQNPQWREASGEVLVVFSGPHAYISPTWYQADKTVPTWNYLAVHVYGTFQLVEEPQAVDEIVQRYVRFYEATQPQPWSIDGLEPAMRDRLVQSIVGFHIDISTVEGKWKLSQNHSQQRRDNVTRALAELKTENSESIAALMSSNRQSQGDSSE